MLLIASPRPMDVHDIFAGLLMRKVTLLPSRHLVVSDTTTVAEYIDDHDKVVAVGVADLPLVAYAGAAIGLLPPRLAAQSVEEDRLPPVLLDNMAEIFSVLSASLNSEGRTHVRRGRVHGPGQLVPGKVAKLAESDMGRHDFTVDISAYGSGAIAFVLT